MACVYSCCFWFSLRLGGILIGIFSLLQAITVLILSCLVYAHPEIVKNEMTEWISSSDLGYYMRNLIESIKSDPQSSSSLMITLTCLYIMICIVFIYGAYTCNNTLMIPYILTEATRLILISLTVATSLLLLKQNSMDIGLLIGASVGGGFLLLGMFYLWICTVNLPLLINEMELEEQSATIDKLQRLLEEKRQGSAGLDTAYATDYGPARSNMFVSRNMFTKRNY